MSGAATPAALGLLRSGLRVRRRTHLAFLLAAALVIAAATIGGVFTAAAQESIARDALSDAPSADAGLHLTASVSEFDSTFRAQEFSAALRTAPAAGRYPEFPIRIPGMALPTTVRASARSGDQPTRLVWREGFCAHLRLTAGRCPSSAGEAVVSQGTVASGVGWALGGTVRSKAAGMLRVVGVYRPRSAADPFWFGVDYFDGGRQDPASGDGVVSVDSVFVTESELVDRAGQAPVDAVVDYPVDPDRVVVGDGSALRADVRHVARSLQGTDLTLTTRLGAVLASAASSRADVARGSAVVALQMVLLGAAVLFFLTLDLTEGRRREIALAKLRGQTGAAVARFALAEPLVVIAAAVPTGVVLGWVGGLLVGAAVLRPGTPVLLPAGALGAAGLALLGAVLAAVVSTRRVLVRPIQDQWTDHERSRTGRAAAIASVLGVALVAACAVAVAVAVAVAATASRGTPVLLVEPGLLLLAAATIGIPLAVAVARAAADRSRASDRIARFLAVRRLARSSAAGRTAALLVITLGFAVFAVSGQSVLAGNRLARAQAEVGAERVIAVDHDPSLDPIDAVRRADPDGSWAMAAATWLPDGGESINGILLAVDPTRLAAVAAPVRGGPAPTALASAVDAERSADLRFSGDRLTASLAVDDLHGDAPATVLFALRSATGQLLRADAGPLRPGTADYSARVACLGGCSFLGFVWTRPVTAADALSGRVVVRGLTSERRGSRTPIDAQLHDAAAWRAAVPVSESSDRVSLGAEGVTDAFRTVSGESGLDHATFASPLPAVAAPGGLVGQRPESGWAVASQSGYSLGFAPVRSVDLLPEVLDTGVAMDVRALDRALPGFADSAQWQVWLGPSAPADAVGRLQRTGLVLGAETSVQGRVDRLSRDGTALAFSLLLALALAAAVLAVLASAVSTGAVARGRAREGAALRLIGVPARTVVRAAVLEQAVLLVAAAAVALPAGVLAVVLVLPLVRQSSTATPVPPVLLPSAPPLLWFTAAYVVAVGAMGALAAAAVVRAAAPERLREVDG